MRYAAYPGYKPSHIGWLGEVPSHWEVKPLGYVARFRGGATPDTGKPEYWDGDIPWLSPKDMKRPVIEDSEDHVSAEALRNGPLSMIPPDAVLIVVRGMILAHTFPVALTGGPVTINQDMKALVVAQVLQPRFLFWALRGFANALVALADESAHGTRKLETFTLSRFPILLPPSREQRAIADFLDRETAKLDTLVAKKRALIEKLKEKRTALISRTVTRGLPAEAAAKAGLDPHPKLKPSGIDWLGDVPEHWDVKPVKFVARVGNGSTPSRGNTDFWLEGDYPWLNSSVVNLEEVTEPTELVTEAALHQCHLPRITPPAVLIGITGEGKTRGMATTLQIEATINQHLAFVKPRDARCEVRYLRRVFDRAYQFLRNESDGGGSTKGAMTCEQIASLRIPIPPYAEQRTIADYLDRETAKIDRMVAKVEEAIERLQEYRTALITAAVTGKIDVRGAVHDREASVPEPNKARVLA